MKVTRKAGLTKANLPRGLRQLAELDAWLFIGLNRISGHPQLERVVRAVSFSGDGYCYAAMGAFLPLLFPEQGMPFLMAGLLAFLIELPLYWVLKRTFKRRRPFRVVLSLAPLLDPSDEFSFPSGHTTAAFMMATLTSFFFPVAALPMFLWASCIGLSRVMLRVHFISDVLAGVLLGIGLATLSIELTSLTIGT